MNRLYSSTATAPSRAAKEKKESKTRSRSQKMFISDEDLRRNRKTTRTIGNNIQVYDSYHAIIVKLYVPIALQRESTLTLQSFFNTLEFGRNW